MQPSVQLTVGLVTRSAVSAARPHPNAMPPLQRIGAECCRSAAPPLQPPSKLPRANQAGGYAKTASPRIGRRSCRFGAHRRHLCPAGPTRAKGGSLPAGLLQLRLLLRPHPLWYQPRSHPEGGRDMPPGLVHLGQLLREIPLKHAKQRLSCVCFCVQQTAKGLRLQLATGKKSAF
jgi:hypothetical protein